MPVTLTLKTVINFIVKETKENDILAGLFVLSLPIYNKKTLKELFDNIKKGSTEYVFNVLSDENVISESNVDKLIIATVKSSKLDNFTIAALEYKYEVLSKSKEEKINFFLFLQEEAPYFFSGFYEEKYAENFGGLLNPINIDLVIGRTRITEAYFSIFLNNLKKKITIKELKTLCIELKSISNELLNQQIEECLLANDLDGIIQIMINIALLRPGNVLSFISLLNGKDLNGLLQLTVEFQITIIDPFINHALNNDFEDINYKILREMIMKLNLQHIFGKYPIKEKLEKSIASRKKNRFATKQEIERYNKNLKKPRAQYFFIKLFEAINPYNLTNIITVLLTNNLNLDEKVLYGLINEPLDLFLLLDREGVITDNNVTVFQTRDKSLKLIESLSTEYQIKVNYFEKHSISNCFEFKLLLGYDPLEEKEINSKTEEYKSEITKKQKKDTYERNFDCVICFDKQRNCVFNPCHHLACCKTCAVKIIFCPICNKKIVNIDDVFIP